MMLFDEFYGSYYRAVAEILKKALKKPVTQADMIALCDKYSFGQARMVIPAELSKRVWPLLKEVPDSKPKAWKPVIHNVPRTPLTTLELRWLKAISLDPRIRLFDVKLDFLKDVEPLFRPEDIICFDCYADGDDYATRTISRSSAPSSRRCRNTGASKWSMSPAAKSPTRMW